MIYYSVLLGLTLLIVLTSVSSKGATGTAVDDAFSACPLISAIDTGAYAACYVNVSHLV